jgi:hypothetical protein
MRDISKEAKKDAAEYMAAQMSYGEGAGTRRKLIETAVAYKVERIPGYHQAFESFMHTENPLKHIKNAKRSHRMRDVGSVTSRNIKALARGDRNGMSTPLIIGVVTGVVLHQTGYDKKIWSYTKRKTGDVRAWLKQKL